MSRNRLKIIPCNVNGLNNRLKTPGLLAWFRSLQSDIILLQETHLKDQDVQPRLPSQIQYAFFASAQASIKGVAILIMWSAQAEVLKVVCDSSARWIFVKIQIKRDIYNLISYYGAIEDSPAALQELYLLLQTEMGFIIMGGGILI